MKNKQQIEYILEEMERWNEGDRNAWNENDGTVPFDGTFVFAARQRKITELKAALGLNLI